MTWYAVVDIICDLINPALTIVVIGYVLVLTMQGRRAESNAVLLQMLVGLGVIYGLLFLEGSLHHHGFAGIDYSTHSAYALVFTLILMQFKSARYYVGTVFAAYMVAIVLQGYHSLPEVVVTLALVGSLFGGLICLSNAIGLRFTNLRYSRS